jgi:hypothetical protein
MAAPRLLCIIVLGPSADNQVLTVFDVGGVWMTVRRQVVLDLPRR